MSLASKVTGIFRAVAPVVDPELQEATHCLRTVISRECSIAPLANGATVTRVRYVQQGHFTICSLEVKIDGKTFVGLGASKCNPRCDSFKEASGKGYSLSRAAHNCFELYLNQSIHN